jgi:hypothetical protein
MKNCTVREGAFVEPCDALSSIIDSFSRAKGVFIQNLTNRQTNKPSRSYVGIKSTNHKNGILFNFCPFCGVEIDAPFSGGVGDDRIETLEAKLAHAVEALEQCQTELDQYSAHEYPGDHPVQARYRKRDYDANPARVALAAIKGESR